MCPICRRARGRGCVTWVLAALRGQVRAAGGQRVCHRVARAIHAAAAEPGGIAAERCAALERAGFADGDWMSALAAIAEVEARMVSVLDELHLTCLVPTIPGLPAIGAAAILAETGDPARYDCGCTWVKHAGLAPRANESGTLPRPDQDFWLWPARAARRDRNRLNDGQARTAVAAALLQRSLGYKLERAGQLLADFIGYAERFMPWRWCLPE
jgi:transposase